MIASPWKTALENGEDCFGLVGTQSGLASFDGREFTPISLHAQGLPSKGGIHSPLESSKGDLWVGTDAGVVLVPQAALDQFDPARLLLSDWVQDQETVSKPQGDSSRSR